MQSNAWIADAIVTPALRSGANSPAVKPALIRGSRANFMMIRSFSIKVEQGLPKGILS
jgi:hypothetical protein